MAVFFFSGGLAKARSPVGDAVMVLWPSINLGLFLVDFFATGAFVGDWSGLFFFETVGVNRKSGSSRSYL